MRSLAIALAAGVSLAGPAAAGTADWATAAVSPGTAGSQAALTLKLHYDMTCGRPGPGPAVIRLPAGMAIASTLTVYDGRVVLNAIANGSRISAQLPQPTGVSCTVIGPGVLTLRLVGVRNPTRSGTYAVRARVGEHAFTAQLVVRA